MPGRDARKVGNMSDEYNAETCIMLNCRPTKFAALDEDWVRMGCSCPTLFHRALRFRERLRPGLVLTGKRTTPPLS